MKTETYEITWVEYHKATIEAGSIVDVKNLCDSGEFFDDVGPDSFQEYEITKIEVMS